MELVSGKVLHGGREYRLAEDCDVGVQERLRWVRGILGRAFSPRGVWVAVTQGVALGWDVAAPLALKGKNKQRQQR